MGSKYWWAVGLILLLNYFIQRPALLLMIFSPLVWADVILDTNRLHVLRESFGDVKFFSLYAVSVLFGMGLYLLIRGITEKQKKSGRYAIYPIVGAYLLLIVIFCFFRRRESIPFEVLFILSMVIMFYSSGFVLIAFDCLNAGKSLKEKVQSYFLLNTLHSTLLTRTGSQLGPSGTSHFFSPVRNREQTYYLKKKGVQVALLMVLLKLLSDLIGFIFLGIDSPLLAKLSISRLEIMHMGSYVNIPRLYTDQGDSGQGRLQLAVLIRSMNWYLARISHINFKILLLWMLGFYIKLGVDEPWKSKSFADFFRRTHVYVAHFYRVFVYPILRPIKNYVSNKTFGKYIIIWLMIFVGGMIFQTVSHSYQLMYWKNSDIFELFKVRILSDSLLASCIVIGLLLEKKKRVKKQWELTLNFIFYVFLYSVLMSISASIKTPGFSFEYLLHYFKRLTMFASGGL